MIPSNKEKLLIFLRRVVEHYNGSVDDPIAERVIAPFNATTDEEIARWIRDDAAWISEIQFMITRALIPASISAIIRPFVRRLLVAGIAHMDELQAVWERRM